MANGKMAGRPELASRQLVSQQFQQFTKLLVAPPTDPIHHVVVHLVSGIGSCALRLDNKVAILAGCFLRRS